MPKVSSLWRSLQLGFFARTFSNYPRNSLKTPFISPSYIISNKREREDLRAQRSNQTKINNKKLQLLINRRDFGPTKAKAKTLGNSFVCFKLGLQKVKAPKANLREAIKTNSSRVWERGGSESGRSTFVLITRGFTFSYGLSQALV